MAVAALRASAISRFRAPDGSVVTIQAPGYDLTGPWDASVQVRTKRPYSGTPEGRRLREFHVTPAGNHETAVEYVLKGQWVNKVQAQGGHFQIAHTDGEQGLALWRGRSYEVAAWLPEPKMAGAQALGRFERLRFTDNADGLLIDTAIPEIEEIAVTQVGKHIEEVGLLTIWRAEAAPQLVPPWSGAEVPTGEIWREESDDPSDDVLLIHATPTTVTTLVEYHPESTESDACLRFVKRITELSWTR